MPEDSVERKALDAIGAWVRRGVNVASDRWREVDKKFGRNSPEERRASSHLHDLIGFCMNIRAWVQHPELADDGYGKELRELYAPANKLGDSALMKSLDNPTEQRNLFRAMVVRLVEEGEGCILGEGRSLGPECCRYCAAKDLLKKCP